MGVLYRKYQSGGAFGDAQSLGYGARGLSASISDRGQGATLTGGFNKHGNIKGLLYKLSAEGSKNLRTGDVSKSFGGGLSYGSNIGRDGRFNASASYNNVNGDITKQANLSAGYKGFQGNVGVNNSKSGNNWSGGLSHVSNIGKLGINKQFNFNKPAGERASFGADIGLNYPITDRINATANWSNRGFRDNSLNAGVKINL